MELVIIIIVGIISARYILDIILKSTIALVKFSFSAITGIIFIGAFLGHELPIAIAESVLEGIVTAMGWVIEAVEGTEVQA